MNPQQVNTDVVVPRCSDENVVMIWTNVSLAMKFSTGYGELGTIGHQK